MFDCGGMALSEDWLNLDGESNTSDLKTAWDSSSHLNYLRLKRAAGTQFVQASK